MSQRRIGEVELPLGLEAYRNTALFSDHFLAERLPDMDWYRRDGRGRRGRAAYDEIRGLLRDLDPEASLVDSNEAQCEEDLIRPVLRILGHEYLVQGPAGGGTVTETEVGDEESRYEVEVRLDDGGQVDVPARPRVQCRRLGR